MAYGFNDDKTLTDVSTRKIVVFSGTFQNSTTGQPARMSINDTELRNAGIDSILDWAIISYHANVFVPNEKRYGTDSSVTVGVTIQNYSGFNTLIFSTDFTGSEPINYEIVLLKIA